MKTYFLLVLAIFLLFACSSKKEELNYQANVSEGIYMGYFEYQNNRYWCEIEFAKDQYVEWPSGGAIFQKSYSCLTTGSYAVSSGKLTFTMGALKFPSGLEPCVNDMMLPGEYNIYNSSKSDSLVFEKGSNANRIKYFLQKLQLN